MCSRNCVYRNQYGICDYAGAALATGDINRTRHKVIAEMIGKKPSDPEVRELLKGENCPLYYWNGAGRKKAAAWRLKQGARPDGEPETQPEEEAPKRRAREPKVYMPPAPEEELAKEYEKGKSDQEIATAVGLRNYQVRLWRKARGLECNIRRRISESTETEIERLYWMGLTDGKIAREVGFNAQRIFEWRKRNGLPPNVNSRMTEEERAQRMEHYRSGMTDKEIAAAEGVSRRAIEKWREVNELPANAKAAKGERE